MAHLFRYLCRKTYQQHQTAGVFSLWLRLLSDLGVSVGGEHLSELKGSGMRMFCERTNLTSNFYLSMLASAVVLPVGTLTKALVLDAGGSAMAARSILIVANLAAAAIMESLAHARGTTLNPTGIFVASTLLLLLWVKDAEHWLLGNPKNTIMIIIASYWYASGRGSQPGRLTWFVRCWQ